MYTRANGLKVLVLARGVAKLNEKCGEGGGHTLISEISCVVHHAKLINLEIVAALGSTYYWRKVKAFRPLEGRRCDEIQFEWSHKLIISVENSFHARNRPRSFRRRRGGKTFC